MTYYDRMNLELIRESARAGDLLARAWGWGGPNAAWPLRQFAEWFEENIWMTFAELWDHGQIYDETEWAVLDACTDMLCIPCLHDRHIRYLVRIRVRLRPDEEWDDWPCDIDGLDDNSEDDSSMIFQMDDV